MRFWPNTGEHHLNSRFSAPGRRLGTGRMFGSRAAPFGPVHAATSPRALRSCPCIALSSRNAGQPPCLFAISRPMCVIREREQTPPVDYPLTSRPPENLRPRFRSLQRRYPGTACRDPPPYPLCLECRECREYFECCCVSSLAAREFRESPKRVPPLHHGDRPRLRRDLRDLRDLSNHPTRVRTRVRACPGANTTGTPGLPVNEHQPPPFVTLNRLALADLSITASSR
jgi:hypothetical protein